METFKVNKFGRSYTSGKPLSNDFRMHVIENILAEGGDRLSGYIHLTYAELSRKFRLSPNTVKSIWRQYCQEYHGNPKPTGGFRWRKLDQDDLQLIEILKIEKPSISYAEIIRTVEEHGGINGEEISIASISRAIKSGRLPSGLRYSRKKLTKLAYERFTPENIVYTQLFIDYLSSKDPRKLKFFDEAGVKLPDVGTRSYGHSPIGTRCVEVVRKCEFPNTTLNLLVSLSNRPEYYNLIRGATNTVRFLEFFEEASNAANVVTGRPCLEVGDIVMMDNLSSHHYEGGEILEEWLYEMGIELIYTPSYSPDLNPVEFCFSKVKGNLNGYLRDLVNRNINLAVMEAVENITALDMKGFYEATSYLFV